MTLSHENPQETTLNTRVDGMTAFHVASSNPATEASSKGATETKAKKRRMRGDLYDLSGAVAKLKNRKCPRCGSVMAFHGGTAQRWVCGSCSFTDYGQK